jgi:hypothetical protein
MRELAKAYCAFMNNHDSDLKSVSTGAWGCGIFCMYFISIRIYWVLTQWYRWR